METVRQVPKQKGTNKKKILQILRISVVVILLIGGITLWQFYRTHIFENYKVISEVPLYNNLVGYKKGNNALLVYSNDGAKSISSSGEAAWEISYQLDNPEITWCENMAAVADIGGTEVYVIAENGIPYNYEVIYPIIKHEVARQGVTAVLLDNGTEDFIQLYDINGTLRVDINTQTKTDGIPVDIALSEDGKKLVTLYITFQGDSMICKVTFYNAGEVGKNYINNIVEQKIYEENRLAYDIGFLNEYTLYVLLEDGFALYHMTEVPELICEVVPEDVTIVDLVCVENGIYAITENVTKQRTLTFYNDKGKVTRSWSTVPEYETLVGTEQELIFFSPQKLTIYRANGLLKFEKAFTQSINAVFPAGNNRYFLLDVEKIQTIKLSDSVDGKE